MGQVLAGIDEVGRGAWAGPLVAAVVVSPPVPHPRGVGREVLGVRDSKQLGRAQRERLEPLIKQSATDWGIGEASAAEIDQLGLTQAQFLAYERALSGLKQLPDIILIDGCQYRKYPSSILRRPVRYILGGDRLVYSIAAASIIAKVYRDELMRTHELSQFYGFATNVGYGTPLHRQRIEQHGLSKYHRISYIPSSLLPLTKVEIPAILQSVM